MKQIEINCEYYSTNETQLEKSQIRLATRHFFNSLFYYKKIIYTILTQITKVVQEKKGGVTTDEFLNNR